MFGKDPEEAIDLLRKWMEYLRKRDGEDSGASIEVYQGAELQPSLLSFFARKVFECTVSGLPDDLKKWRPDGSEVIEYGKDVMVVVKRGRDADPNLPGNEIEVDEDGFRYWADDMTWEEIKSGCLAKKHKALEETTGKGMSRAGVRNAECDSGSEDIEFDFYTDPDPHRWYFAPQWFARKGHKEARQQCPFAKIGAAHNGPARRNISLTASLHNHRHLSVYIVGPHTITKRRYLAFFQQ